MFPLFETIRIENGIPQNLEYHQNRFEKSFLLYFKEKTTVILQDLIDTPKEFSRGIVKLKLSYNNKDFNIQYDHYKYRNIQSLKLVYDNDIDYSLKYSDRSKLDDLVLRKANCDDVLIVKNGKITDTSFCNIVFYNGKKWITPQSPLLKGTARQKLLDENKIIEASITIEDLTKFSHFKLINAMLEFKNQNTLNISNISFCNGHL